MDGGTVRLTKEAINRAVDIMGLAQALEVGLDLVVQVETLDTPERREFAAIRRRDGLKAALAWRDARFAMPDPARRAGSPESERSQDRSNPVGGWSFGR
jgi:enoyl-CoA hydratase